MSVQGNVTIGLADVDLLFLDLRLLLGSVDTIWPEGRPPAPAVRPPRPSPTSIGGVAGYPGRWLPRSLCESRSRPAADRPEAPPSGRGSWVIAGPGPRPARAYLGEIAS